MKFPDNFQIEKDLFLNKNIRYVAGVDEVGRGPLAGPLVVAAVILDIEKLLNEERKILTNNDVGYVRKNLYRDITDSKQISHPKRLKNNLLILNECVTYSIISIDNTEIDVRGMGECILDAFDRAVGTLNKTPDFVITDMVKIRSFDPARQLNIVSGDSISVSVGAASIIAKVFRDNIMVEEDKKYPVYGFSSHKGYGTKKHLKALFEHGPCEIHRKSFSPISKLPHNL